MIFIKRITGVNIIQMIFDNFLGKIIITRFQVYIDTSEKVKGEGRVLSAAEQILSIPRRPDWKGLTPTELKDAENDAFLDWRRFVDNS